MVDFEFLEHTADIAVRVYAKTLKELFINSAQVMFGLITDYKSLIHTEQKIHLQAESWEDLLIYWLNELLSLFYSYNFLPCNYNIIINTKNENKCFLEGKISGQNIHPLEIKTEIKAATYHNVKIEKDKKGFKVDIVFDI